MYKKIIEGSIDLVHRIHLTDQELYDRRKQLRGARGFTQGFALILVDFDKCLFNTPLPTPGLWELRSLDLILSSLWFDFPGLLDPKSDGNAWLHQTTDHLQSEMRSHPDHLLVLLSAKKISQMQAVKSLIANMPAALQFDAVVLRGPLDGDNQDVLPSPSEFKLLFLSKILAKIPVTTVVLYDDNPTLAWRYNNVLTALARKKSPPFSSFRIFLVRTFQSAIRHLHPTDEISLVTAAVAEYNGKLVDPETYQESMLFDAGTLRAILNKCDGKRIEVRRIPRYSGIALTSQSRASLIATFPPPRSWLVRADHVTLSVSDISISLHKLPIVLTPYAFGYIQNRVMAVAVRISDTRLLPSDYHLPRSTPLHITLATAPNVQASESLKISTWLRLASACGPTLQGRLCVEYKYTLFPDRQIAQ